MLQLSDRLALSGQGQGLKGRLISEGEDPLDLTLLAETVVSEYIYPNQNGADPENDGQEVDEQPKREVQHPQEIGPPWQLAGLGPLAFPHLADCSRFVVDVQAHLLLHLRGHTSAGTLISSTRPERWQVAATATDPSQKRRPRRKPNNSWLRQLSDDVRERCNWTI